PEMPDFEATTGGQHGYIPVDLDTNFARAYLEKTTTSSDYLEAINPDTAESLQWFKDMVRPLAVHIPNPKNIVSVGVGAGIEVHALKTNHFNLPLFPPGIP